MGCSRRFIHTYCKSQNGGTVRCTILTGIQCAATVHLQSDKTSLNFACALELSRERYETRIRNEMQMVVSLILYKSVHETEVIFHTFFCAPDASDSE